MTVPDLLIIGHITRDVVPGGYEIGGTVSYAGLTAQRLGARVAIVTSCGPEIDPARALPGLLVHAVPSAETTTFANLYHGGERTQYLLAVARPLTVEDVPPAWRTAPVVLLAPVANEVSPDLARALGARLLGATPQGWLRAREPDGRVRAVPWTGAEAVLPHLDVLVFSEYDIPDPALVATYVAQVPLVVVTQGARGATLFQHGRPRHLPAYPTVERDPTGAGDVFAAAFLLHLARTGDPVAAMVFAHCTASFAVEQPGTRGIPTAEQVAARLRDYHRRFGVD